MTNKLPKPDIDYSLRLANAVEPFGVKGFSSKPWVD